MKARVVDGKVTFLEGNEHAPMMGTSLCARGVAGASQLYDKDRLIKPLIRVGKRGENRWREASYEEAIIYVAQKMNEIKARHGAQSILFSSKTGESFEHLRHFAYAFGSPNTFSHWSSCPIAIKTASEHTFGAELNRDFANTNYILNFGHNLFEGIDITLTKPLAQFAANPSKKLVVLEPRFSIVAAKADEWHPIKAGSDLAFVLALLHVWIRDGKFNHSFVNSFTVGFEHLKASTKETTPQWQKNFTGIDASVVEKIADELYRASPKCIIDWGHKATTTQAEYQRTRAILIANVLMGNIEKEGGIYFPKEAEWINAFVGKKVALELHVPFGVKKPNIPRIDAAGEEGAHRFISSKHGVLQAIPEAILSQKPYPIKGWVMTRHNPLMTVANPEKMKEAMEALELIVVNDIYASESAMMADVIFPEASYLERDEGIVEISDKSPMYAMRSRVVEPMGKTLSCIELFRSLALHVKSDANYSWQTVLEYRLAQSGGNEAVLEELVNKGIYKANIPPLLVMETQSVHDFSEKFPFLNAKKDKEGHFSSILSALNTPSGKIEIFSSLVESAFKGQGVPRSVDMDVRHGYPYVLITGKTAIHTNGHTHNVPHLSMLMSDNPVWINPLTAKEHGLKQGDTCYLKNDVGRVKTKVFLTEGIRPDTLFAYMGFGRESVRLSRAHGKGLNPSKLTALRISPICGSMVTNVGVEIEKA
jgi:thiosulfate reductase/polysulfide reductase chain A